MLRYNTHIGKYRHEIGITGPTRHNMHMQMVRHAGTCNLAKIDTHIETLGFQTFLHDHTTFPQHPEHLILLFRGHVEDIGNMSIGSDEKMAVCVGKLIHDHKGMLPAPENQSLGILPLYITHTKDATVFGLLIFAFKIGHAPWRPEMLHSYLLSKVKAKAILFKGQNPPPNTGIVHLQQSHTCRIAASRTGRTARIEEQKALMTRAIRQM